MFATNITDLIHEARRSKAIVNHLTMLDIGCYKKFKMSLIEDAAVSYSKRSTFANTLPSHIYNKDVIIGLLSRGELIVAKTSCY